MPHVKARSVNSLQDVMQTFTTVALTIRDPAASSELRPHEKHSTEKDYSDHEHHQHEHFLEHNHQRKLELRESKREMSLNLLDPWCSRSKPRRQDESQNNQQIFPNEEFRTENDSLNNVRAHPTLQTNSDNNVQARHREVHNNEDKARVDQQAGSNNQAHYRGYYQSGNNSQNYVGTKKQSGIGDQRNVRVDVDRHSENNRTHTTGDEYYLENCRPTHVTLSQQLGINKKYQTYTDSDRQSGGNHQTYIRAPHQSRNNNQTHLEADHLMWNNNRAYLRASHPSEPSTAFEPPSRDFLPQTNNRYTQMTANEPSFTHHPEYLSRPPRYIYETEGGFLVDDTSLPVRAGRNPQIRRYKLLNFPHEEGKNYKFNSSLSEEFDLGDTETYCLFEDEDRRGRTHRRHFSASLSEADETNPWEKRNRIGRSRSHEVASTSRRSLGQTFLYPTRNSHRNVDERKEHFVGNHNYFLNPHRRDKDVDRHLDSNTDAVLFRSNGGGTHTSNYRSEEHLRLKHVNTAVRCNNNHRCGMKSEEGLSEKKSFRKSNVREDWANMTTTKRETRVSDTISVCSDTDSTDSQRSAKSSSASYSGSIVEAEHLQPGSPHRTTKKKVDNSRNPTVSNSKKAKTKEKKASEPHKSAHLLRSRTENNYEHTSLDSANSSFSYNAMTPSATLGVSPSNPFSSVTSAFPLLATPRNTNLPSLGLQSSLPSLQTERLYTYPDYHFNLPKSSLNSNALNSPLLSSLLASSPSLPPFDFSSPLSSPYPVLNTVVPPVLYRNQIFQSLPLCSPVVSPFSLNSPGVSYFSLSSPLLTSFPFYPNQQQESTTYSGNDTRQSLEHNTSASIIKPGQVSDWFLPRTTTNSIDFSEPVALNQKPTLLNMKHDEKATSHLEAMSEFKANSYRDQSTSPGVNHSLTRDTARIHSEIDLFQTVSPLHSDHTHGNLPDAVCDIHADYVGSQSHLLCRECSAAFFTHLASFESDNKVQNTDDLSEQMSSLNTTTNTGSLSIGQKSQSTQYENKEQVPTEESEWITSTDDLNRNKLYSTETKPTLAKYIGSSDSFSEQSYPSPFSPKATEQTGCISSDASDDCEGLFKPDPASAYFLVSRMREMTHDGEDTGRVCENPRWMDTDHFWDEDKFSVTQICSPSRPHPPSTPIPDADYDVYPRKHHGYTGEDIPDEDYSDN